MSRFKVGDKVTVKSDLIPGNNYGIGKDCMFASMLKWNGKVVTIAEADSEGWYGIEEDDEDCWDEEMFCMDPNDIGSDPNDD